jgi:membrane protease YdiL (CAAX protease family)
MVPALAVATTQVAAPLLAVLANTAPEAAAPVTAASSQADLVIVGTYLAAALVFALFAIVRAAQGKTASTPPPLPTLNPEDAALYAPGGQLPPPLPPSSPYTPPGSRTAGHPLVPSSSKRILSYFRAPTAPYRRIDLLFIGLIFLIFAGLTTGSGGQEGEMSVDEKYRPDILVISMFFQVMLMGIACAFMARRIPQAEWLGLRWKQWWLSFAIAPSAVFFMWITMGLLAFSGWNGWLERTLDIESMQESVKLLQEAKDPLVVALMAIAAVIVAPIAEEVVFRGYLYPASKHFCGPVGGILFSSLVFAAAHGNVVALAPLFLLAVLLCLIYEFTGSIWASISVHFLFNAATVAIQLLFRYGILEMPPQ